MSSYAYVSGEDSYALVKDGTKSHIRRGDGLCESDVYYVFLVVRHRLSSAYMMVDCQGVAVILYKQEMYCSNIVDVKGPSSQIRLA
jgi:hypothetical protein